MLSRSLCLYELVDLRNVSREDRKNALEFYLQKNSPFPQTGFHAEWQNGLVMVWFWNKAACQQAIEEQAVEVFEILPETVLRIKPDIDGLIIQETLDDGFDLQFWSNNTLLSSRWHGTQPTNEEIIAFTKGLPRLSDFDIADTTQITSEHYDTSPISQTKWAGSGNGKALFKGFNFEPALAALVLLTSVAYIQWQTIGYIKADNALITIEESIDVAFSKASPIVDAKDKSLLYQQQLTQTQQLIDFPDQVKLMSTFGNVVKDKQGTLKEWRFALNKLELTIETQANNALEYVNTIQSMPLVAKVTTEPARETNQIKIIIELSV